MRSGHPRRGTNAAVLDCEVIKHAEGDVALAAGGFEGLAPAEEAERLVAKGEMLDDGFGADSSRVAQSHCDRRQCHAGSVHDRGSYPFCMTKLFAVVVLMLSWCAMGQPEPPPSAPATPAAPVSSGPEELLLRSGGVLRFLVNAPQELPADQPVPVLIAVPPGKGGEGVAKVAFERYWSPLVRERWVVISPLARGETPLLEDAQGPLSELIDEVLRRYRVEGGHVHVAGASSGGVAAFRLAIADAARVASLVTLPGFADPGDAEELSRLRGVRVRMAVGSEDAQEWIEASSRTVERLRATGCDASLVIRQGEGHLLAIQHEEISALFASLRQLATSATSTPEGVLDDFHDAAAKADGARYFAHFASGGVFLGTDGGERWTVEEFRRYAEPYFSKGKGWTYRPFDRHVNFNDRNDVAWFDEKLENSTYGECRGSGVLVLVNGRWLISQYNLTVPVPNDLLADVARQIREHARTR